MSLNKIWRNLKISNLYYLIQGYYIVFIKAQYDKYFDDDSIDDLMFKSAKCPECYLKGECVKCGCPIDEMFNSDKPCPDGKF